MHDRLVMAGLVFAMTIGCGGSPPPAAPVNNGPSPPEPPEPVARVEPVAPAPPEAAAPVATPPPTPVEPVPPPPPADPGDPVKPPTAEDLAEYTRSIPGKGQLTAKIVTSLGTLTCALFEDKTPITVANFVGLATGQKPWRHPGTEKVQTNKPLYDGLTFHRVIPGFMIQGGDPVGEGTGGPGYTFGDEIVPELTMKPGTLAMANAGPSTNGSQFFITETAPDWLNGHHTIFGSCREVKLVKKIASVRKDDMDRPVKPVKIKSITFSRR